MEFPANSVSIASIELFPSDRATPFCLRMQGQGRQPDLAARRPGNVFGATAPSPETQAGGDKERAGGVGGGCGMPLSNRLSPYGCPSSGGGR